ncbi:MAG: ribosome-associated translation inhibitor RaiA [Patescibacteria group bacterium]
MRVSLKGTNTDISQSIRDYLDEKIVRLVEKLIKKNDEIIKLDLEVGRITHHHRQGKIFRAEANLSIGSRVLYADSVGEDLYEAIDLLEEELRREIKKFKNKKIALERSSARVLKNKR